MFSRKLFVKNRQNKKIIYLSVAIMAVLLLVIILGVSAKQNQNTDEEADFSSVDKICELATLRCYYHDVAEYEKQPEPIFKHGLFKYGYKKMWIEYDGIVTVGIDFEKVQIEKPDMNSTVRIYVPDAQVFDVDADEDSMSDPFTKTGKFTKITVEEKADAFSAAQATMRTNAESDNNILTQAKNNAKELIKQYVINVGKQIGKEYKVEWINESKTNSKEKGD